MATFGKINVPSLKDICVQAILSRILSGELKPGDRLPAERDLADSMGISRSSVNHGIMELENMGFLTITPRRGTIVNDYRTHPTPQSLAAVMRYSSAEMEQSLFSDLMATRLLIEGESARLACSNIYDTTLSKMQKLVDELTLEPEDPTDLLYLVGGGIGDDADLEVGDVEGVLLLHGVHPSCPPSFCTKSTKERQNIQNVLEIIGIWEYNRVNTSHYPYYNTKLVD